MRILLLLLLLPGCFLVVPDPEPDVDCVGQANVCFDDCDAEADDCYDKCADEPCLDECYELALECSDECSAAGDECLAAL